MRLHVTRRRTNENALSGLVLNSVNVGAAFADDSGHFTLLNVHEELNTTVRQRKQKKKKKSSLPLSAV
jgi:hypothetical protein